MGLRFGGSCEDEDEDKQEQDLMGVIVVAGILPSHLLSAHSKKSLDQPWSRSPALAQEGQGIGIQRTRTRLCASLKPLCSLHEKPFAGDWQKRTKVCGERAGVAL